VVVEEKKDILVVIVNNFEKKSRNRVMYFIAL
jgi:hypothetical protein